MYLTFLKCKIDIHRGLSPTVQIIKLARYESNALCILNLQNSKSFMILADYAQ